MCKHNFIEHKQLVMVEDSVGWRWWQVTRECNRCHEQTVDYECRKLTESERTPRPPRKSRKPGLAYLRHVQGDE
jgi:hypothetical protein